MLRARNEPSEDDFIFHSSRMRLQEVTKEALDRMDSQSERGAALRAGGVGLDQHEEPITVD